MNTELGTTIRPLAYRIDGDTLVWQSGTITESMTKLADGSYRSRSYRQYQRPQEHIISDFAAKRRISRMIADQRLPADILLNLGW